MGHYDTAYEAEDRKYIERRRKEDTRKLKTITELFIKLEREFVDLEKCEATGQAKARLTEAQMWAQKALYYGTLEG